MSKNKKSKDDLVFDALLDQLMATSDAELLAEHMSPDLHDIAASTLNLMNKAVMDYQREYVAGLNSRRKIALETLAAQKAKVPSSTDARRRMLQQLSQDHSATLQYRDLKTMTDDDVESALQQLLCLIDATKEHAE